MPSPPPARDVVCWPRNRCPPPASACCRARAPPLPPPCPSSSPPASCPSTGDRNPAATPGSPKPMNPSAAHSSRWPITGSREGARSWFSTTPTPPTTIFCSPCSASPSVTNPSRCVTPRLRPPPPPARFTTESSPTPTNTPPRCPLSGSALPDRGQRGELLVGVGEDSVVNLAGGGGGRNLGVTHLDGFVTEGDAEHGEQNIVVGGVGVVENQDLAPSRDPVMGQRLEC